MFRNSANTYSIASPSSPNATATSSSTPSASSTSKPSSTKIAIISGSAGGGALLLALIAGTVYFFYIRKRNRPEVTEWTVGSIAELPINADSTSGNKSKKNLTSASIHGSETDPSELECNDIEMYIYPRAELP
jgi:uncharacterized protein HemX